MDNEDFDWFDMEENNVFKVECNDNPTKYKSVPNNFSFHDFKFYPFCGRKIRWLKAGGKE